MTKLFKFLKVEITGNMIDVVEQVTKSEAQSESRNANILIRSESCSELNDMVKEVIGEAESHPVIVPPGENKALYDFAEITGALYHAEKKVIARRLKTKPRNFKRKQQKQKMIIKHMENVDLESFVCFGDVLTLEVVY
ncbi:hypothetical protein CRYUN_Cryun01aG0244100 [Craigia yunnanensis]